MASEIETLLQGTGDRRSIQWWHNTIAHEDSFFGLLKAAMDIKSTNWDEIGSHLLQWRQVLEDYDDGEKEQWAQAAKMYLIARFLPRDQDGKKFFEYPLEGKTDMAREIYELFTADRVFRDVLSDYFPPLPHDEDLDDILLLCSLFTGDDSRNWSEVQLAARTGTGNETGEIFILMLKKVAGYGKCSPNPTFLKHSGSLARQIKDSFSKSIDNAFRLNQNFWRSCTDEEALKKWTKANPGKRWDELGIIWEIKSSSELKAGRKFSGDEPEIEKEKSGESAGLAASVGIFHVLLNQVPEDHLVYSARLETDNDGPTGKFIPVAGIPAKINAAIASRHIDTFVMHKGNYEGQEKERIRQIVAGSNLRLVIVDAEGTVVEEFPEFEENAALSA